ncbi:MAG: DUF6515 family protein [Bacteroidales bacterium]
MKRLSVLFLSLIILATVNVGNAYAVGRSSNGSVESSQSHKNSKSKQKVELVKKPKTTTVKKLPKKAVTVNHKGNNYYKKDNKYYKRSGGKYVVSPPPFGLRVPTLPRRFTRFVFGAVSYYCASGVIYARSGNEYVVVEPTVGMIVPELPTVNVSTIRIDGTIYYEFDNILYIEIPTQDGIQYRVEGYLE